MDSLFTLRPMSRVGNIEVESVTISALEGADRYRFEIEGKCLTDPQVQNLDIDEANDQGKST